MTILKDFLLVGIGGALGSMARYGIRIIAVYIGLTTTTGTLAANILGSFLIGLCIPGVSDKTLSLLLILGFLGGFTSFSSFSSETINMIRQGETLSAILYIIGMLTLCLLSTYMGMKLHLKYQ